ncbi:hypothetical protein QMK17_23360 [Rhodococcus sp. G-MC3]|uniref:hypothetical protein n=1 Tax=Rhodococcus sp. G-MC3 TaxID=3046209 RepID=UPI0024BAD026|nr:hypothetical protein [Rhodococcus sp. G-MC3]MDJ0396250.1 hypothetical protein [Rhodococcus sp. G-MC3]
MPRRWEWSGLLRGDGWTASWRGFRPLTGEVELVGRFSGNFGYDTDGRFRGRITRVRMVSERIERRRDAGWTHVPGHRGYREVDFAPKFFGDPPMTADEFGPVDLEQSVAVDIDLDDVPALPIQPSVVPGDVSVAGRLRWIADSELPLIVVIASDSSVTEYRLPVKTGQGPRIWATETGCWATGTNGTYWISHGDDPVQVDDRPVYNAAINGCTLLTCTDDATWRLYSPDATPIDVDAVHGWVNSLAVEDDSFIAVVRPADRPGVRLVRVSVHGETTIGPEIPSEPRGHGKPYLAGSPLRLIRGVDMALVQRDLRVRDDGEKLGHAQFHGGQLGHFAWTIGHPPDGTSSSGWWPLPGPVSYDRGTQFWLFTMYDAETFAPLTSVPVFATRPHVTIDHDSRILLIGRGVQMVYPHDPVMQVPIELNVADLVDDSRRLPQS